MTPLRILTPLFLIAIGSLAPAQVLQPEKPKDFQYEATVRYRIRATGPQRIVPFEAMAKHLKEIGFKHTDAKRFDLTRVPHPRLLTDAYLLGLAVARKGRLVTFDQGIPISAVLGATGKNFLTL